MTDTTSRAQLLAEAKALEDMGGDWTLAHAAAFARCSVTFLVRSDCPKHQRRLNGVKGKLQPYLVPAEVRAWDDARKVKEAA